MILINLIILNNKHTRIALKYIKALNKMIDYLIYIVSLIIQIFYNMKTTIK